MNFIEKKFRHELKFYINYLEMPPLVSRISTIMKMDKHSLSKEGYNIRSLYFDGVHDHAIYDKNEGIFGREKYRIRIYNGSDSIINLERKSKYGDFISKESVPISRDEYDAILNGQYEQIGNRTEPLIRDFYHALQYRNFKPRVIVDYIRAAYTFEPGNVRVTFDKELKAGVNGIDLFDDRNIYENILYPEQLVLEVKFDKFLPDVIRQLVQPERLVRSSISKYVLCRERTIQYFK
ncbi:polyphosphate polymerase domain-containing protein [Solibacillus sp. MA9]|uniref:Polyphosphate polymerase domain-containing protein n=1 Tax=Solibacillus palustris TaxID=2908203 RepID=A0ABS9UAM7_9BACL|nr:polyphosphate polymerase domain-containing protein [Solibacillus sp. MA9]MCH7321055.1 polyphosphate polymerase domain-containing protein [Solibacillus sp. MA9]